MIREGWGVVYIKAGAEYGGDWGQETYLAAQAEAQCVFILFPFPRHLLGFHLLSAGQGCAARHMAGWHEDRVARRV
jgi:hypothetical protein